MKLVDYFEVDVDGFPIQESVILIDEDDPESVVPDGYQKGWSGRQFFKPRFDLYEGDWIETLTQEEIDAITNPPPPPPTEVEILKQENADLKASLNKAEARINDMEFAVLSIMNMM